MRFLSRGPGYTLFLTGADATLALTTPQRASPTIHPSLSSLPAPSESIVHLKALGARATPSIVGVHQLLGTVNYFTGNDPRRWHAGIPTFASVMYRGIYHGIDLRFRGTGGALEYDWIVHPGANPSSIRLSMTGQRDLQVAANGELHAVTGVGALVQKAPLLYQTAGRHAQQVPGRFALGPKGEIEFRVGRYDRSRPLVIDPVLSFATQLGGGGGDMGLGIAVDAHGSSYVTGSASSSRFPTRNPLQAREHGNGDAFVAKLNRAGNALVYSTYLGGRESDDGIGIAVDARGDAYVAGETLSDDFPTAHALQKQNRSTCTAVIGPVACDDAFVAELGPAGNRLIYSTYLGGDGIDDGYGIAVDGAGNAYVTGRTDSNDFPTVNPFKRTRGNEFCQDPTGNTVSCEDAFVAKIAPGGTRLLYSTYLGGSGIDEGNAIAVDRHSNMFVVGDTNSENFPTVNPIQRHFAGWRDVFVLELRAGGRRLAYSTYLGGSNDDMGMHIALDRSDNAYLTGYTRSHNFPVRNALQPHKGDACRDSGGFDGCVDAFVTKVAANGRLVYSTYLGGNRDDEAFGVAVGRRGNVYIGGDTDSKNFTVVKAPQSKLAGGTDVFVSELNAAGNKLVYSTFLGGSANDYNSGLAIDGAGNAYVAGFTFSRNFPAVNPLQRGNGDNALVAKIGSAKH